MLFLEYLQNSDRCKFYGKLNGPTYITLTTSNIKNTFKRLSENNKGIIVIGNCSGQDGNIHYFDWGERGSIYYVFPSNTELTRSDHLTHDLFFDITCRHAYYIYYTLST